MSKEVIIDINGLKIRKDSIYKVTNKLDNSAPTGFVKEGTTKLPSEGIGNTIPCRFIVLDKQNNRGIYDTGLYEESPCYSTMDKAEVKQKVQILRKTIVEPYERKHGVGVLDHKNEEFWDNFGVNLFEGRFFVTDKVEDLLELFISMVSYELTPKNDVGNPKFRESQYCIEDKEEVRSIKDERADNVMTAIVNFGTLLATDKATLVNVLKYINLIGITEKTDDSTIKSSFYEWMNKSDENIKKFQAAYELSQNAKKSEIIELYSLVLDFAKKGVITKESGQYMYNGNVLGADLKTVANNLSTKKDLNAVKIELLELY